MRAVVLAATWAVAVSPSLAAQTDSAPSTRSHPVLPQPVTAPAAEVPPEDSGGKPLLPRPSGPHAVGTAVVYLTDSSRTGRDPAGRPVTLQLWYPARVGRGTRAPYLVESGLVAALDAGGYYDVDSSAIAAWARLRTHAGVDAEPLPGPHTLVTWSVGLGVVRANYTTLAEGLASAGYVVALIDSPLEGLMVTRTGRVVTDTAGTAGTPAGHRAAVRDWAADVVLVIDRVQHRALPGVAGRVAATVEGPVVSVGHSSGGLVAIAAAEQDPRIEAAVDLDGGLADPDGEPIVDFLLTGVRKPTLMLRSHPLYSDQDFARRGLTRAEWERRGLAGQRALDSLVARSHAPLWLGAIGGTGHLSFSDAPFVMPSTITRFGGRIIDPSRGLKIITATIVAFLHQTIDHDDRDWAALPTRFRELTLRRADRADQPPRVGGR